MASEKKKWWKRWWFRVPVLIIAALVVVSQLIPNAMPTTCVELAPAIIDLSKEQKNPLRPTILKIYEVKQVEHEERVLNCTGRAKLTNGQEQELDFYVTKDADGDYFHGYKGR